jgi:CRISPR-associated protein Csm4
MVKNIEYDVIKLNMKGALHLSRGKSEMDAGEHILHSDKLKSAIASVAFLLYSRDESKSKEDSEPDPGWSQEQKLDFFESFKVSSAYPFWKEVYLFPKPMKGFPAIVGSDGEPVRKKGKKIKYLDQQQFQQLLLGKLGKDIQEDALKLVKVDPAEEDLIFSDQVKTQKALMKSEVVLRVSVARDRVNIQDSEDTQLYYLERLFFGPDVGLFFFIEFLKDRDTIEPIVHNALRYLGDEGIGTDRGTGNGHFEFNPVNDAQKLSFQVDDSAEHQLLLSLYCPDETDDLSGLLEDSAYRIQKRGGYIASTPHEHFLSYRKRSIYMFSEGAVFSKAKKQHGQIADLQPKIIEEAHPIWRDGRGIFLPIKLHSNA